MSTTGATVSPAAGTAITSGATDTLIPLDPPSRLTWAYETLHPDRANRTVIARCRGVLDRDRFDRASKELLRQYPVLNSRVRGAHSERGHRYVWKRHDDPGASFVEWERVGWGKEVLEEKLTEVESLQLNTPVDAGSQMPVKIFVKVWEETLTHVQVVVPAALFDDRSVVVLLAGLFAQYARSATPQGEPGSSPAPVPRDWEEAFDCALPLSTKATLRRIIGRDESAHRQFPARRHNDLRDWPALVRFLGTASADEERRSGAFDCFPRQLENMDSADAEPTGRAQMLRHVISGERLRPLEARASGSGDALEAMVEAALVRAQLDLEHSHDRQPSGRTLSFARVMDLRPFAKGPSLAGTLGNLSAGVPTAVPVRDQGLMKTSHFLFFLRTQKANALRGWKEILQSFLLWDEVRASVSDSWLASYLRAFMPEPLVGDQITVSHLGRLEEVFGSTLADELGLEGIEITGQWPARLSVVSYRFGNRLHVNAVHSPLRTNATQADMLWERMRANLEALAEPG